MTDLTATFLASLAASYASPVTDDSKSHAIVEAIDRPASPVVKPTMRKLRAKKEESAPIELAAPRLAFPVEPKGTIDAKGFVLAMRAAGTRYTENGIPFTLDKEILNDKIRAIAAFTGYDAQGPRVVDDSGNVHEHNVLTFGAQELRANMTAIRALDPRPVQTVERRATGKGYVAGMPDYEARRMRDLIARERLAADTICETREAAREALSENEMRLLDQALAMPAAECFAVLSATQALTYAQTIKLEEDRLAEIRAALES
jgi:hypothetical protein